MLIPLDVLKFSICWRLRQSFYFFFIYSLPSNKDVPVFIENEKENVIIASETGEDSEITEAKAEADIPKIINTESNK